MGINTILAFSVYLSSCLLSLNKTSDNKLSFSQNVIALSTHNLTTYNIESNSKYLIVFESGLGDGHSVWLTKGLAEKVATKMDVLLYDRAGYGKSTIDTLPRNIDRLRSELELIVDRYSNGRKVILVGHSLGGLIIRDYAIKNPTKVAALLFIDSSHEYYNQPSQAEEDKIHKTFNRLFGPNFGGTKEVRELIEDLKYCSELPNLPNIPVVAITSMKINRASKYADKSNNKTRIDWFNAHEQLKKGLSDFTHIKTQKSGHYIMKDEPELVINSIELLLEKLK